MARAAKGTPTALNTWVLAKLFRPATQPPLERIPNQLTAVDAPHVRRCLKAGLLEVDPSDYFAAHLRLTDAGRAAVDREVALRVPFAGVRS